MARNPLQTDSKYILKDLLKLANSGEEPARSWLNRIERHGITKGLAKELRDCLMGIPMTAYFAFDEGSKSLVPRFSEPKLPNDVRVRTAFAVALLLSEGALDGLKRCALPAKIAELAKSYPDLRERIRTGRFDCKNFFVKNSKGKWCSDKCGSDFRVTERREKEKRDQVLGSQQL